MARRACVPGQHTDFFLARHTLCLRRAEVTWCLRDGKMRRERGLEDVVMAVHAMYEYYLRKDGTVFWSKEAYDTRGAPPPPAGVFDSVGKVIALTGDHDGGGAIMLLSADGRVYRWRDELVAEDPEYEAELKRELWEVKVPERVKSIYSKSAFVGIGESGRVYNWGNERIAPPLTGNPPPGVVAVQGGAEHTCLLTDKGQVHCRGANDRGQLGLGQSAARSREFQQVTLAPACRIRVQQDTTYAVLEDGSVWWWGDPGLPVFIYAPQRIPNLTDVVDEQFGVLLLRDGTLAQRTRGKPVPIEFD